MKLSDPNLCKESLGFLDISFDFGKTLRAQGEVRWEILIGQYGSRRSTVAGVDYLLFVKGKQEGSSGPDVTEDVVLQWFGYVQS